jgi:Tfp pilus assembly protein PilF
MKFLLFSAACALKLNDYQDVLFYCEDSLKIAPDNTKALMRRAQAYKSTQDWDLAKVFYLPVDAAIN